MPQNGRLREISQKVQKLAGTALSPVGIPRAALSVFWQGKFLSECLLRQSFSRPLLRIVSAAVVRLDAMIETMRRDGTLREFNARYKAGRAAAAAEGRGYMNFAVVMKRLSYSGSLVEPGVHKLAANSLLDTSDS